MTGLEAAFVSGLLKVIGKNLVPLVASEFSSIMGVTKDLSELQDILAEVASWLSTVCDRAIERESSCGWVVKLKNIAHDIDDLLYEVFIEAEKHKIGSNGDKPSIADCFCAKPKSFLFRRKIAHKIESIKLRFSAIVKNRNNISTIVNSLPSYQHVGSKKRSNGELSLLGNVEQSKIPIRNWEKDIIISELIESNEAENDRIVSIVGLGGSGKTTLAKHICHDDKIKQHFKAAIFWVHVSQEFNVEELIGKIESVLEQKADLQVQQYMVHAISSRLSGKRFLLVLDDAWHDDRLDWEQFMVHVNCGALGSKILLTTRDRKVAEAAKSGPIFNLAFLPEVESWSLFLDNSGLMEEDLGFEFLQIGKEIVKKCGGVPLAIKTLGGILHDKREINTWRAMRESNLWNVDNIKDRVFASLKLSYFHMPDHLKQCFTFCSIFPKGYEITKNDLIAQWIANRLIDPMDGDMPEDIGSAYFESLTKLCFLQCAYRNIYTYQLVYKMHDLIHDLTRQILQHEMVTSLQKNTVPNYLVRCRYVSLTSATEKVCRNLFDKVHALFVSGGNPSFDKVIKKCSNVRSVVLDYTIETPFPLFILNFESLGFLRICNVSCTEIPEAISGCWNLQGLHIMDCKGFTTLPESIGKLKKLRALELFMVTDLKDLPHSIGDCHDLRSLQLYFCDKLIEIPKSIGRIEKLNVLDIVNCAYLHRQPHEFIGQLRNLETINLSGCYHLLGLPSTFSCRTLRTLDLSRTKITLLPQWVTLIGTLKCIKLEYCWDLVELPKDIANLRGLEILYLDGCSNLRCIPSGFGRLTRLRCLGLFVVGCGGDDARILELENLDMISGWLGIHNLKYVKDPGDAKKACLKKKNNIHSLTLNWSRCETEEELVSDTEQDLGVLDSLEPPSGLKLLQIIGYQGPHLPCWMMKQHDSSCLELPQFLWLSELSLEQLPNMKRLQGLAELPSLKSLRLIGIPNLEELWIISRLGIGYEQVGVQHCFPVLTNLIVRDCPNLYVKPYLPPCLEKLTLERSNEHLLSPGSLFSGPLQPHVNKSLLSCSALVAVPHFKELRLRAVTSSSSVWEVLQHFTGLEYLGIHDCTDMRQLPESIGSLTAIQKLVLSKCDALTMLPDWIGQLSTLRSLSISECSALESLPPSIQCLTALQELDIYECPGLTRRYEEEVGDDRNLISHIPHVRVIDLQLLYRRTT